MAKIIGGSVATPIPVADWKQTNPNRADYIKNKPFETVDEVVAVANAYTDEKTAPATSTNYGTVKLAISPQDSGIDTDVNGRLYILGANTSRIDERKSNAPITPRNLEYAVKSVGDGYYALASDVGDIDTALDAILAMQENLIGGGA